MRGENLVFIEASCGEKQYWRDILVRYKQTTVGIMWVVNSTLLILLVFTFAFGKVAKLSIENDIRCPLLALAGLLPW